MSVKERLIQFIKYEGIPVRRFEARTGLSFGYVNAIRVSIQPDKVSSIAREFPNLNTGWLLTGEGEMLKPEVSQTNAEFEYIQESANELPVKKLIDYLIIKDTANLEFAKKNQEQMNINLKIVCINQEQLGVNQEQLGENQKQANAIQELLILGYRQIDKSQAHVDELINLIKFHGNLTNGHSVLPNNHVDVFEPKVREN